MLILPHAGLFNDEKEAASAYDRALVRLRGVNAATNCALSDYGREMMEHQQAQVRMTMNTKKGKGVLLLYLLQP